MGTQFSWIIWTLFELIWWLFSNFGWISTLFKVYWFISSGAEHQPRKPGVMGSIPIGANVYVDLFLHIEYDSYESIYSTGHFILSLRMLPYMWMALETTKKVIELGKRIWEMHSLKYCADRESNPSRKNGNLAWYQYTTGAIIMIFYIFILAFEIFLFASRFLLNFVDIKGKQLQNELEMPGIEPGAFHM